MMAERMQPLSTNDSTATLAFWRDEALMLRETAELCWSAEQRARGREVAGATPSQQQLLHEAGEALGVELELLYRYLMALAIQYLAIGILIGRDPFRFLRRPPGHRIVSLVEECGVAPSAVQRRLIAEVENAFAWGERYPVIPGNGQGADGSAALAAGLGGLAPVSAAEKEALNTLFAALMPLAQAGASA